MASYFFSDIHLKPFNDPRTIALSQFLDRLDSTAENIFFLGDIFDFWMGGHKIWQERYKPLVVAVKALRARGVKVYFFEGNHDIHIHPFWEKELGVQVFINPQVLEVEGIKIRIEHGDLFNPDDNNYLFLRRFLRSWPMRISSINAPGRLVAAIADWGSATSHKYSSQKARDPKVIEDIKRRMRRYAIHCAQSSNFDVLIMGHTHIREDYEIETQSKKVRFINLGSWFEPQPKALVLEHGCFHYCEVPHQF